MRIYDLHFSHGSSLPTNVLFLFDSENKPVAVFCGRAAGGDAVSKHIFVFSDHLSADVQFVSGGFLLFTPGSLHITDLRLLTAAEDEHIHSFNKKK